jgi:hypothetical protein
MIKTAMTPTEAFLFRLKHEQEIKAVSAAIITTAVITAVILIVLSPILIPLEILSRIVKAVRK